MNSHVCERISVMFYERPIVGHILRLQLAWTTLYRWPCIVQSELPITIAVLCKLPMLAVVAAAVVVAVVAEVVVVMAVVEVVVKG